MQNEEVRAALLQILLGRRERILKRWLTRLSPLTNPTLSRNAADDARICFEDLAVTAGLVEPDARPYWSRAYRHLRDSEVERLARPSLVRRGPDQVCASLPHVEGASEAEPAYVIVDVAGVDLDADGAPEDDARPVRAHLYQLGPGNYRLVGVERPDHLRAPDGRD